jgi:hypothetical protein
MIFPSIIHFGLPRFEIEHKTDAYWRELRYDFEDDEEDYFEVRKLLEGLPAALLEQCAETVVLVPNLLDREVKEGWSKEMLAQIYSEKWDPVKYGECCGARQDGALRTHVYSVTV